MSPIACKALHSRLTYLLTRFTTPALSAPSFSTVDDFLVRALYVPAVPPSYPETSKTGLIPNDELHNNYATDSADSIEWFVSAQNQDLHVSRWICSCATEIFFEGDRDGIYPDNDEIGLAKSVISCLLRLPKDVRSKVMQAVIVVGGGAAIPGVRTRLQKSLESLWEGQCRKSAPPLKSSTPEGTPPPSPLQQNIPEAPLSVADLTTQKKTSNFRFIATNPLEATFLGASLFGDVKVRGLTEVSREGFNSSHGQGVMDWTFVGGLGDEGVEESKRKSRSL